MSLEKFNELNSAAYSKYVQNRTYILNNLGIESATWLNSIQTLESNIEASCNLNRDTYLQNYLLCCYGYKRFCGDNYESKMADKTSPNIITLNGFISLMLNSTETTLYNQGSTLGSAIAMTNPDTVKAQEIATANTKMDAMSNEIVTATLLSVKQSQSDFYTNFLKF